ncbi:glycosyltransferase family 2 protein [Flavobacterium sp. SOK18b]|uniref:glycosyltransferase family 2 protein n=1 Tax=Flavobacterium sp. SOK18b TaxID=797900 RepID=UPI0015F883F9|nr:glycosyltransferase family 2 protein [Flavobacterium sp. SOK18b]MBB1193867.1 glycosyltransferase family 2 protein [Flavobacterium sp. SOK18b]
MISVCIATYNGEKFIKEQIESILPQLDFDDEIIISDDRSVDNTIKIINEFNEKRIKVIFNKLERGYTNNFENAINNANGDFIFLSDQDDVWMDNRVSETMNLLIDYDLVACDAKFVDEDLKNLKYTFFSIRGGAKGFLKNLYRSQYLGACLAFKKEILIKLLPFPQQSALCPHDLWISLIAEFYFKTAIINKALIKYRRHGNNVSTGGIVSSNSFSRQIKFRIYCLVQVILRIRT